MEATCTNAEKVLVTAAPNGRLDGPLRVTVVSGDGTSEPGNSDLEAWLLSGDAGGDAGAPVDTVFQIEGDRISGPGEEFIGETFTLHVTAALASTLGLTVGSPVPK